MTAPAIALPWQDRSNGRRDLALTAGSAAAAAFCGLMVGVDRLLEAAALAVVAGALAAGVYDWRSTVYGLLLFLPFSGIPYIVLYPNVRLALFVKDALFVVPAYAGFVASRQAQRRRIPAGALPPAVVMAMFGLLVVAQVFNPELPNRLVGLIGAKVWLFYLPLCLLGYHLVETRGDLNRLLATMSLVAVAPALIGLVEAALVYTGHPDLVYRWYGGAAESATQGFVQFDFLGGGSLRRIPSTFSFTAQYFSFTVSMVAITYAWWRGVLTKGRLVAAGPLPGWVGAAAWLLLLTAGLLSGARAAILFIPFLVALIVMLEARGLRLPVGRLMVPSALVVAVTVVVLGAGAGTLVLHAVEVGVAEFQSVFVAGIRHGLSTSVAGLGTGIDTNGARYAFDQPDHFTAVSGSWYESWYVKAYLELGLAGLVLVVAILGHLVVAGLRRHATLRDPRLRTVSACLLALVIWNLVYAVKAQFMDLDPTNVYFWLLVGVLARLPELDTGPTEAPA